MKLDVSDVMYDNSSVSSDSGTSQSSHASHDFLSNIANATIPNSIAGSINNGNSAVKKRNRINISWCDVLAMTQDIFFFILCPHNAPHIYYCHCCKNVCLYLCIWFLSLDKIPEIRTID
ncbi:Protein of unknown function [Cotesia congregata]|uniref:Uncharacterized protein n=1 Tax=Cotesia congregata TaxID=51543 RepID=A0A8J2HQD7_COTCN|nr:Protein of unknown function [Cotesia congregata]